LEFLKRREKRKAHNLENLAEDLEWTPICRAFSGLVILMIPVGGRAG